MSAAAGWEIARRAWRRNRAGGGAFAIALAVNGLVIWGFVASIHTLVPRDGRVITVMIVPPFVFDRAKPPPKSQEPATQAARVHATAPTAPPTPVIAPLPPAPKPPVAPPASGKWTPTPDLHSRLGDQPSVQRSLRVGAACAAGELSKLSQEDKEKCLDRWARTIPPDDDGMHHHPPPNDPGGEFARAAAALEQQRRPMQQAPMGQCPVGTEGSNLHRVCTNNEKGSLVQQMEHPQ